MTKSLLIGIMLLSTPAFADIPTVKGDKAAGLVRALKYSGVKPKVSKGFRNFATADIHCWSSREGEDAELGDYKCTIDKTKTKDAAAYLLQNAMEAAGLEANDHMSQHTTDASGLMCTIDPSKTGAERFECHWSDIKITPKKTPPKDIVQPVKIEKQK